jgi:transposase
LKETQTCAGSVVFASQHRCLVAIEVCAISHFWARAIVELGHDVRLIP